MKFAKNHFFRKSVFLNFILKPKKVDFGDDHSGGNTPKKFYYESNERWKIIKNDLHGPCVGS